MSVCCLYIRSHRAGDLTGTEASGADIHMSWGAFDNRLDALYIGLPGAVGTAVRVGHLDSKGDTLITEFTLGHFAYLLAMKKVCHCVIQLPCSSINEASKSMIAGFGSNCKAFFKNCGRC